MGRRRDREQNTYREVGTEESLDEILSAAVDVLIVVDADGIIQTIADDAPSTLGYAPEQLTGQTVLSLFARTGSHVPVFDVNSVDAFETTVLSAETDDVVVPVETADGTIRALSVSTVSRPETQEIICIGRDVSEQVFSQHENGSQRELLDTVADPLYVLGPGHRFQQVNQALVEYTGYERSELIGRDIGAILSAESDNELIQSVDAMEEQTSAAVELTVLTKDGNRIATEANVTVLTETGSQAGSVGVLRDISDRKHRERNLELLKQVLTRVFRHNIRNELMIAKGHAELLGEQADEALQTHADQILDTADRLLGHSEKARLIEQVMDRNERYEIPITETVRAVVTAARNEYPAIPITTDLPDELSVMAHPEIERAIEELIANAIQHAPGDESTSLEIWLEDRGGTVTLFVEDESGGLADHEIEVLERGIEHDLSHSSGVGLWLVRWLVEYSGAEMIVHRTDDGSLLGIRFAKPDANRDDSPRDLSESPLAPAPEHVQELSTERFRGDTVIGRVGALNQLRDIYDSLERTGGHAVFLTGEAGIGKTTLVEQFCDQITSQEQTPIVATGACEDGSTPPYHAFRHVLDELSDTEPLDDVFRDTVALSVDDSDGETLWQHQRSLFADIASQIRSLSATDPVVLVLEDMQWADSATIALFEYLVDEVGQWGHPVMFVGTCRTSDVEETHPVLEIADKTASAGRGTVLELEPFDTHRVESLLSELLAVDEIPASLIQAVHDHTGGTPLFISEIGRQIAEKFGPVQHGSELPETLGEITVPDTVERAITDRLETLPDEIWSVVQLGAIIGSEFSFDVLREASELPTDALIEYSNTLVRRDIWRQTADGIEFVHGVLHEQTLEGIDNARQLHARVAAAIETVHADDLDAYAGQLGFHYEQIDEFEAAIEYYRQAGEYAFEQYAHEDAIDYYERALTLGRQDEGTDRETLATLHADLGEVFNLIGNIAAAQDTLQEGLSIVPEESVEQCKLLDLQASAHLAQSEYEAATETAERQRQLAQSLGEKQLEADALFRLGETSRHRGEYENARAYHEQALTLATEIGYPSRETWSHNSLGLIARRQGEYDRAREHHERSLEIARETGNRRAEGTSLLNLAVIERRQNEYDSAKEFSAQSLELKREVGDRKGEAASLMSLGIIADKRGANSTAREYYQESMEIYREIGDQENETYCLINLGSTAMDQADYEQAIQYFQDSLDIAREIGNPLVESTSLLNLGTIARYQGAYDQARDYCTESLDIAREIGDSEGEAWCLSDLGLTAIQYREYEQAREYLTTAVEKAREIGLAGPEIASLLGLAASARQQGEYEQAAQYIERSLTACDPENRPDEHADTQLEQARLALAREDLSTARESIDSALETFAELDAVHRTARAKVVKGKIAAATDEYDTASAYWREALETFQDRNTPQDALDTLQSLIETAKQQENQEKTAAYRKQAREVFESAPESVQHNYREWIDSLPL